MAANQYKVLLPLSFCKYIGGEIGIASGGFAAEAWCLSDEAFDSCSGTKFYWTAPDGGSYMDARSSFTRPTEEEILRGMTQDIIEKALQLKLIELV